MALGWTVECSPRSSGLSGSRETDSNALDWVHTYKKRTKIGYTYMQMLTVANFDLQALRRSIVAYASPLDRYNIRFSTKIFEDAITNMSVPGIEVGTFHFIEQAAHYLAFGEHGNKPPKVEAILLFPSKPYPSWWGLNSSSDALIAFQDSGLERRGGWNGVNLYVKGFLPEGGGEELSWADNLKGEEERGYLVTGQREYHPLPTVDLMDEKSWIEEWQD